MLWLTLRQHRMQVLVTAGLVAAYGILLLTNGISGAAIVDGAPSGPADGAAQIDYLQKIHQQVALPSAVMNFVPFLPLVIGVFWGVPVLAREFERGTQHIAWTQSISRFRWLATKLSVLGALVVAAGLVVGAMTSAWLGVYQDTKYGDRFGDTTAFSITGIAPAAWCVFGFGLGVAAGAVTRKMLPAMAILLALTLSMMGLIMGIVRGHYATPDRIVNEPGVSAEADMMLVKSTYVGPDGQEYDVDNRPKVGECPDSIPGVIGFSTCLEDAGHRMVEYSHSPDKYWRFQWTETGLLVLITVGLAGLAVRQTARRPA